MLPRAKTWKLSQENTYIHRPIPKYARNTEKSYINYFGCTQAHFDGRTKIAKSRTLTLIFRHEGRKYRRHKYIYSERSILVLSENPNRFHLWPLELYFRGPQSFVVFGVPTEAVSAPDWLKKWRKITSPAFLSMIFGFLVLKNLPGVIFRVIGSIFLPQVQILWQRVPPSRHLAMAVFWPQGPFLASLKNRVPKHPRI